MEFEKVKNHKHREDMFDREVIARWSEIDSEEKESIKLILMSELGLPALV